MVCKSGIYLNLTLFWKIPILTNGVQACNFLLEIPHTTPNTLQINPPDGRLSQPQLPAEPPTQSSPIHICPLKYTSYQLELQSLMHINHSYRQFNVRENP